METAYTVGAKIRLAYRITESYSLGSQESERKIPALPYPGYEPVIKPTKVKHTI